MEPPIDTQLNLAIAKMLGWTKLRIKNGGVVRGITPNDVHSTAQYASDMSEAFEAHRVMCSRWFFSRRAEYYVEIQKAAMHETGMNGLPQWPDVFELLTPRIICIAIIQTNELNTETA